MSLISHLCDLNSGKKHVVESTCVRGDHITGSSGYFSCEMQCTLKDKYIHLNL